MSEEEYRILRKTADGAWVNLYPPILGGTPPTFKDKDSAEERALKIEKNFAVQTKVVTVEEALEHGQPRKEY